MPNTTWDNDAVQFPRLLAELRAVGLTNDQYRDLTTAMDLTFDEIDELLERAETAWQAIKAQTRNGVYRRKSGTIGTPLENQLIALLYDHLRTWEDEEESVKTEHAELIARTAALLQTLKGRTVRA
jgi:hypothetical protein